MLFQCHLRVSVVHPSCNPGLDEQAAMRLIWDSPSQIRRNDRMGLAASLEIKRSVFTQTRPPLPNIKASE